MFNTILENFHIEKIIGTLKNSIVYMIVAGVACALVAGVFGSSFSYSSYRTDVTFYVYSDPDSVNDSSVNQTSSEITQANRLITSYVQVLKSSTFLNAVLEEVQLSGYSVERLQSNISTKTITDTAMFVVYVYDSNPANALTIANAISDLAPKLIPSVVKSGGFRVLDAAELPTYPYSSLGTSQIMIVGFALGVFLAFLFFFIKGILDTTIRRVYEVEDIFNIPIVGQVPNVVPGKDEKADDVNIVLKDDSSFIVKEAYNTIRANMLWGRENEGSSVFVVTSADTAEGKTVNAYNVAKAFSMVGKKVVLIDADMRNSVLRTIIPNESATGLADYLSGKSGRPDVVTVSEGFDVIYASENIKDKSELLSTQKWYDLIEELKNSYDEIVIDMPCLALYSDALCMARTSAYYIIVIREGLTKFVRTKMIVRKLEELNADIFGIIYNGISTKSRDYVFRKYKEKK